MATPAGKKYRIKNRASTRIMRAYRRMPFFIPRLNNLIRFILKLHFWQEKVRIGFYCRSRQDLIDQWYQSKNIFFGLAIIKSGTNFLADFLNQEVPDAIVQHEAVVDDYWSYAQAFYSDARAYDYIKNFRQGEIYHRVHGSDIRIYGEINPFLRRHAQALRQVFPRAKFFHLVRDGRDVVRSIMSRATFDRKEPLTGLIRPLADSPYHAQWDKMSRLARVCWLWQEDNRYLRQQIGYTVQFEKLISDYDYCKEKLLDYLGLDLSRPVWQKYIKRPKNVSPVYKMPRWPDWSEEQKNIFKEICGEEMAKNDYTLN